MSPIKPTWKTEIAVIILIIVTIVLGFYFYAHFPDQVASHWNFEGEIDGWSSRGFGAFFVPLLLIGMYLLFIFLPYIDPRKDRYQEFAKAYHIIKTIIIAFLFLIYLVTGLVNLGYNLSIGTIVPVAIGIMFIIIGYYMGTIKYNWFVGIRTPWTLSSETVWNKTHKVGGWLFIALGIVMIIMPLLPKVAILPTFIIMLVVAVGGSFGYSYYLYYKENQK